MNVTFHEDALIEFEEAARWYRERSLNAAQNFQLAIARAIQQIVSAPQHFPLTVRGHRKAVLHRFPYLIIFHHEPDRVIIVAIAHGKRRAAYWRSRSI